MTMSRFCNDMLLHITNRRFARARSSETNFLIPAVGALQAPCKHACFITMGALFPKKLRSRLSAVHTFEDWFPGLQLLVFQWSRKMAQDGPKTGPRRVQMDHLVTILGLLGSILAK